MVRTKYIVGLSSEGAETVVVFGEFVSHYDIARAFQGRVVAAGFCDISGYDDTCTVSCWGESVSLRKTDPEGKVISAPKSRGQVDVDLIRKQILNEEVF